MRYFKNPSSNPAPGWEVVEDVKVFMSNIEGEKRTPIFRLFWQGQDSGKYAMSHEKAVAKTHSTDTKAGRRKRRARKNSGSEFTVYHADHGIKTKQLAYIKSYLEKKAPQGFFLLQVDLPKNLGTVPNAMYGPAAGDAPVSESEVFYADRGGRGLMDRMVSWPTRPVRFVQAIGIREGDKFTVFTIYGGQLAPQHPDDPNNRDLEGSRKFWSQHALSGEQWAQGNPRMAYNEYYRQARSRGRSPEDARKAWARVKRDRTRRDRKKRQAMMMVQKAETKTRAKVTAAAKRKATRAASFVGQYEAVNDEVFELIEAAFGAGTFVKDFIGAGLFGFTHATKSTPGVVEVEVWTSPKTGHSRYNDPKFLKKLKVIAKKYPKVNLTILFPSENKVWSNQTGRTSKRKIVG